MIDDFEDYMRDVRRQRSSERAQFWKEFAWTLAFVAVFAAFLCAFHAAAPVLHALFSLKGSP